MSSAGLLAVAVPLVALAFVVLVAFSGCGLDSDPIDGGFVPPSYSDDVLANPSLVAFWQLNEEGGKVAVDSSPNSHDGAYASEPVPADVSSAAAPGDLAFRQPPPLLANEPENLFVRMNGARVEVPLTPPLQSPSFTVLAWAFPQWDSADTGNVRTVATTRENPADNVERGWSLTANGSNQWEANICDGTAHTTVNTGQTLGFKPEFLAITYDGTTLTLYVDAEVSGSAASAYVPGTVPSLFIGEGRPDLPVPRYPFVGLLGDVSYFDSALSAQDLLDLWLAATSS